VRRALFVIGLGLTVFFVFSRGESPLEAQPSTIEESVAPTIRVSTRLVVVDVVVTDRGGKPIKGLRADDFVVQEKGKTQKVAFFSPPREGESQPPASTLPPGIYSNKPEYRSSGGPITVLVLDAANTPFKDQAYARQQMLKFAKEQYQAGRRFAIYTLTNSLGVLEDFTGDPQVLVAALEKYKPQEQVLNAVPSPLSGGAGADSGPGMQALLNQAQNAAQSFQAAQVGYALDRRVEVTLQAMRSLARVLGGMPGRKQIIWLTAEFPFELIPENRDVSDAELLADLPNVQQKGVNTTASGSIAATERQAYSQQIRDVAAQLANAQLAIYPIDVRGLVSGMEFMREDGANRQSLSTSERALERVSDMSVSQDSMREIAKETGGMAYINQNEIRQGVALAIADASASYTLGYYPEDKKWDGKYRSIKVKVNRDNVETRYRRGYFAIDRTQLKDRKPEQEVAEALQDKVPDTQVIFSAQVKPAEKGKLRVDFLVDANSLSAEDASGGGKKLNMLVYAAIFAPDGKILVNRSIKVDQAFDAATFQQILQKGMLLHMELDGKPGKNELRLAVLDNRTGSVGTLLATLSP
jgi:VWFA-related protein